MRRCLASLLGLMFLMGLSFPVPQAKAQSRQYIEIVFDISGSMDELVYPEEKESDPVSHLFSPAVYSEARASNVDPLGAPSLPKLDALEFNAPEFNIPQLPSAIPNSGSIDLELQDVDNLSPQEALPLLKTRMQVAQDSLRQTLGLVGDDVSLGFRVFGRYCSYSELLVPFSTNNQEMIIQAAEALQPSGDTPLAHAISQARKDLESLSGRKKVIIITDGEESCEGDVLAEAKALVTGNISADLIFFGSDQLSDTMKEFVAITKGTSVNAINEEQLTLALEQSLQSIGYAWWWCWLWVLIIVIVVVMLIFWYRRKKKRGVSKKNKSH